MREKETRKQLLYSLQSVTIVGGKKGECECRETMRVRKVITEVLIIELNMKESIECFPETQGVREVIKSARKVFQ